MKKKDQVTPVRILGKIDNNAALNNCRTLGLNPIPEPLGDDHHTDVPFSAEDKQIGEAVSFFLGDIFVDKFDDVHNPSIPFKETYWFKEMTSIDLWTRIARALRIHGLKISNDPHRGRKS